jgi:hypothetical protein
VIGRVFPIFARLQRHPFGVEAFFRRSLVLTYAVPASALVDLVGPGLELETYDNWGFLAIAMVQTEGLRPQGLPRWFGREFFLSGYRLFTRLVRRGRSTLRGLRILRSDTDSRLMASLGNVFTQYNYQVAKIVVATDPGRLEVLIRTPRSEADLEVVADLASIPAALPEGSPFRTMEDARMFAGPLPFTFSYDTHLGQMVVVKGLRKVWDPQPVRVAVRRAAFLESSRFAHANVRLANACYLENVPYAWKPGMLEAIR